MNSLGRIERMGVTCDFCHRVSSVHLKENTSVNTGVMMLELMRSSDEICSGMTANSSKPVGNSTKIRKSSFCASCHQGSFWGVPVYNTYSEWLASDYAKERVQCQHCHMPDQQINHHKNNDVITNESKPSKVRSHVFYGSNDSTFLARAVEMTLTAQNLRNKLSVEIQVKNKGAGHFLPTGQPMRNLILLVKAIDANSQELTYNSENRVPIWGGRGEIADGNWEGLPGKGFAKVLFEHYSPYNPFKVGTKWQHIYPASQWRNIKIKFDTRIPPLQTDISAYSFDTKNASFPIKITATLIYRKTFKNWANMKKWKLKDIVIAQDIKYMKSGV
jgi:hypothetical protein